MIRFDPQMLIAGQYHDMLVSGLLMSLQYLFYGLCLALPLGLFIALCRLSPYKILRALGASYVEVVRSIPLLAQMLFWYFGVPELLPEPKSGAGVDEDKIRETLEAVDDQLPQAAHILVFRGQHANGPGLGRKGIRRTIPKGRLRQTSLAGQHIQQQLLHRQRVLYPLGNRRFIEIRIGNSYK